MRESDIPPLYYYIDVAFFVISILALSHPFFFWHSRVPTLLLILVTIIAIKHLAIKRDSVVFVFLFFPLYILLAFRSDFTIWGAIMALLTSLIFVVDEKFLSDVFKYFVRYFSLLLIPSIIIFILVIIFKVDIPYNYIEPLNELKDGIYREYPFLVVFEGVSKFPLARFAGYWDEPGMLGTIAAVVLYAERFNLRKIINIPILVAGLLSLSLFFYVSMILYAILFAPIRYRFAVFILIIVLAKIMYSIEYVRNTFLLRFSIVNGKLAGDSRTNAFFDQWYESFVRSQNFLWGLGGGASAIYNKGGSSYKDIIVNYGFIFFILYILNFTFFALSKIKFNRKFFIFIVLFLGIMYQRPSLTDYFYIVMLVGVIDSYSKS